MSPSLIQTFCESAVNTSHKKKIGVVIFFLYFDSRCVNYDALLRSIVGFVEERENKKGIETKLHERGEKVTNIRINANVRVCV